jgi:hypothetical protein
MPLKRYLLIIMTVLITGCSAEEPGAPRPSATPDMKKAPETVVTITPDDPTSQSVIVVTADASVIRGSTVQWYVNGTIDDSAAGMRFTSPELKKGDSIQAVLISEEKEYPSNEITIVNSPPLVNRAVIKPALPRADSLLEAEVEGYDIDGDPVYFTYKWNLNGKFMTDLPSFSTQFKRDDMITLEVIPFDGEEYGKHAFIKSKIYNSIPVVTGNAPTFDGKTYTYNLDAKDIDGDTLTYKLLDAPEGMTVDKSGVITWQVSPEDTGRYEFTVLIIDNSGGELVVPITARIGIK